MVKGVNELPISEEPFEPMDWPRATMRTTDPLPGKKFDQGKNRWDLLPWRAVEQIVVVLTFGATKYGDENWRSVERPRARYYAAMQRHLYSWFTGEQCDPESGTNHLAHAGACLVFLLALDLESKL